MSNSLKKLAISNDGPLSNVDLDDIDLISDKQAEEIEKNISGVSRNFDEKFNESNQVLKIDHVQGSTSNLLQIFETKFLNNVVFLAHKKIQLLMNYKV